MNFKNFFEMASFTLPEVINFDGNKVGSVDMQFELPPKTIDKNGRVMNQGSKFIAKMPNSNSYLAYDGKGYSYFINKKDAVDLLISHEYEKIPNNWWEKAIFI